MGRCIGVPRCRAISCASVRVAAGRINDVQGRAAAATSRGRSGGLQHEATGDAGAAELLQRCALA